MNAAEAAVLKYEVVVEIVAGSSRGSLVRQLFILRLENAISTGGNNPVVTPIG